jgi:ABC-type transport system involved in multi-copper enzyme maturation permease subunit
MKTSIVHIASNTFREAVRDRVLYNLIAFALLLSGAAILVGQISIEIEKLVVINLGLTAVSLFGVVIAIFIGIGLVSKEIEKRTLYTVSLASGAPLGIHRGQIPRPGGHAGGEYLLHGD